MELLAAVIRFEAWFFLLALSGIVVYKMLTGGIITNQLLMGKTTKSISPARIQLLLFTLAGSVYYLSGIAEDHSRFPELPTELLALIGGSHLLFLGSKGTPRLLNLLREFIERKMKG